MDYTDKGNIELQRIQAQFKTNNFYSCTFPYINRDTDIHLSTILKAILMDINQEEIYPQIEYTLNELSMNASKANSKRIYFKSKGLDINNNIQYNQGILDFKNDVFNDFKKYEQLHIDNKCYVNVKIYKEESILQFEITNNSPILDNEKQRIEDKIKMANKFNNLEEVLAYGFDTSEGGGFGLIIMLLMLRKVNLDEKALTFWSDKKSSTFKLTIPLKIISKKQGQVIAGAIANEIELMPQFPQSIIHLQKELNNPNCSFNSVAETIKTDLSLSAEIIRIANSPVYRLKNKIENVNQAVKLVGMLGVKAVLYNYGVNMVFDKKYNKEEIDQINHHSYYVALIASYLMQYKKLNRLAEDVYIVSLLHDMGKIIINSINDDLEVKLTKICREKHIPISVLEDLTEGFNHALIGSEVAKNWNFPNKYIETIKYHHLPLEVSDDYKVLTYSVYIGNEIYYLIKGVNDFHDINFMVLSFFGLENEDTFFNFIDSMKNEILIPDYL